jgi:hypothetical protein
LTPIVRLFLQGWAPWYSVFPNSGAKPEGRPEERLIEMPLIPITPLFVIYMGSEKAGVKSFEDNDRF